MSYESIESIVSVVAGILQFIVAAYALRLNRVYGAVHVGWSLFCAFSLLALVHVVQFLVPSLEAGVAAAPTIEVMYAMVAMLLLMGMVHMESLLKERRRREEQDKRMHAELESEVKKKTAYLTRAIEELQMEIDRRTAVEFKMEQSNTELFHATQQVKAAEKVSDLLHKMMEVVKSVNISAGLVSDHMKQSKIANVVRVGNLVRDNAANLALFMSRDPRGQKLPQYIAQLAEHLDNEQTLLTRELDAIKKNIEEIMAMQQDHAQGAWKAESIGVDITAAPDVQPAAG
jgi:hypothetical protein